VRVVVDKSECVGHLQCVPAALDVFEFDDDRDVVAVVVEELPAESVPAATSAVSACPVQALRLIYD
jgi:ferredoxin